MKSQDKWLGELRETRAKAFMEKWFRWDVKKANFAEDKYHYIDFVCSNSKGEKIFVQVKGMKRISYQPSQKALKFAIKNNAKLYYCFVPYNYNQRLTFKLVDPETKKFVKKDKPKKKGE